MVDGFRRQIGARDLPTARATLAFAQRETRAAKARTGDAVWWAGRRCPATGDDLHAVRRVSAVADDITHQVPPVLADLAELAGRRTLMPHQCRLNLSILVATVPRITSLDTAVRRARERTAAVDTADLAPGLAVAVAVLNDRLGTLTAAARGLRMLPAILGVNGPQTYLLLFQNLAEVRATGGIAGAYAVVRADRGTVQVVARATAGTDLRTFDRPVLTSDPSMSSLDTDRLGRFRAHVNLTPPYPTAATLTREMYLRRTGTTVDGVLSTEPVALSYVLDGAGRLDVPGGPGITAPNAGRILLLVTYLRPPGRQDRGPNASGRNPDQYLIAVAAAVFYALTKELSEPMAAIRDLVSARRAIT